MKINTLVLSKLNSSKILQLKEKIQKKPRVLITLVIVIVILIMGTRVITSKVIKKTNPTKPAIVQNITLNNSIDFIGLDLQGKSTKNKIKMSFVSAEKSSEVLVKDQTYKAKEGKTFLIVNLELRNDTSEKLNLIPGDLIRLTLGTEDKKYAPDLHNNAVLVAPQSVKNDRIGFVIDSNAQGLKLLVGELEKKKEEIEINF